MRYVDPTPQLLEDWIRITVPDETVLKWDETVQTRHYDKDQAWCYEYKSDGFWTRFFNRFYFSDPKDAIVFKMVRNRE
jgi:hypothetical protein